jgi:hypothetical protein
MQANEICSERESMRIGRVGACTITVTLACALAPWPEARVGAQTVHNEILETPTTRLELIGLKRWTLAMIQDSLARYAPGESLVSHACAAILREKLGFADAAVQYSPPGFNGRTKGYFAVPVVEPQDSARVRYRELPRDSLPHAADWAEALAVFEKHNQAFQSAIQAPAFLLGQMSPDSVEPRLAAARQLLKFLRAHRTHGDRQVALRTLARDSSPHNRVIAAVMLAGFVDSDSSWWALADALRDQDGMVSATASQVLSTMSRAAARPVNWAPVADGVRAVLDGTNLFAHNTLLEALVATRVDSTLAPALLRGGGELVLAKLRSEDLPTAGLAQRFLTQLSGRDFGQDAAAWENWIRSL